jgi:outer membrane protein assembly factor BamB
MTWGQPLGLDELMIVNPSSSNTDAYFLSADGTLYQVQGLGETAEVQENGQYFLGDDGTLYQVQGLGETEGLQHLIGHPGQYFLGNDGTLYQIEETALKGLSHASIYPHSCQCQTLSQQF